MANVKHGVVRTDRMYGTRVEPNLISLRYMGSESTPTAIDNGNVVLVGGLLEGERELFSSTTPKANSPLKKIALVATPEVCYDPRKKNLEDFYNEVGGDIRGYFLHEDDIFSVTMECLDATGVDGTPAVGNVVELMAGTKLKVTASLTGSSTQVGKIIEIEQRGARKWFVVMVG